MSLYIVEHCRMSFLICYRDGVSEMFDTLEKNDVPLLIFSAGVGGMKWGLLFSGFGNG